MTENKEKPANEKTAHDSPKAKRSIIFGITVITLFVGSFAIWAAFAPLESAALATGKVIVYGYHRTIQHLEGGIVKSIHVKDGSKVKKGQILMQLDDNSTKVSYQLRRIEVLEWLGVVNRLQAEKKHAKQVTYSQRLMAISNTPKGQEIMKGQTDIFNANELAFNSQLTILEQKIRQFNEEIKGIEASKAATEKQLVIIQEEIKSVAYLEKRKLIERSRLLALQREQAQLHGKIGEDRAKIASSKQQIGEAKLKITSLKKDRRKEILTKLRESQQELSQALEKEKASADILSRTTIRSPKEGVIVGLKTHTVGGVIKPGDPIMDVVPNLEDLIVEARVNPNDIDVVHQGLVAKIQLTAFKLRSTPTLLGKVNHVSADIFTDQNTGESYYLAQVMIGKKELEKLPKDQKLYPGMPVAVMIITAELTPWQYFVAPIKQSFHKAFREQ